jgi:hypothetical protein
MSPYASVLGKHIEVEYRGFGTTNLLAVGTLISISDDLIVIEEHRHAYGIHSSFQTPIRYGWIVRFREITSAPLSTS